MQQQRPARPSPEHEWYSSPGHRHGGWWQRNGQRRKAKQKDRDRARKRAKPKALEVQVRQIEERAKAQAAKRAAIERARSVDTRSPAEVAINRGVGAALGVVALVGAVAAAVSLWGS